MDRRTPCNYYQEAQLSGVAYRLEILPKFPRIFQKAAEYACEIETQDHTIVKVWRDDSALHMFPKGKF